MPTSCRPAAELLRVQTLWYSYLVAIGMRQVSAKVYYAGPWALIAFGTTTRLGKQRLLYIASPRATHRRLSAKIYSLLVALLLIPACGLVL